MQYVEFTSRSGIVQVPVRWRSGPCSDHSCPVQEEVSVPVANISAMKEV